MDALRSLLFVPASKPRALEKAPGLPCDAVILDLEDSAAPEAKADARAAAIDALAEGAFAGKTIALRVNGVGSAWFEADLEAVAAIPGCAVVIPKTGSADDLRAARAILSAAGGASPLWAMIETPLALMNLKEIGEAAAETGLAALVCGPNDLAAALRLPGRDARAGLVPHLAQIVAAARAYGLAAYDGVYNDFTDAEGFAAEARQARGLGFDGKTLIHPGQIEATNRAFAPTETELAWARSVAMAFAAPENSGKAAIAVGGEMVERMHLRRAEALLAQAAAVRAPHK